MTGISVPAHIVAGGTYAITKAGERTVTVRVSRVLSACRMDSGRELVTVYGIRVRPADLAVSFGREHVYIASPAQYTRVK